MGHPLSRFAALAARPDAGLDLAEGAFLIAASEYLDLDVDAWMARLDELAAAAWPRVEAGRGDFERLTGLTEYLYGELGLAGNRLCYYDPRNSYLNDVLERRVGIPISLAVVAMEIGRRVEVPLLGVNLPCHFLLVHARHPAVLLDPFDGGRFLTEPECAELLARASGGGIRFRRELLKPAGSRQILFRMLNNLRGIHATRGRPLAAAALVEYQLLLTPGEARLHRDRGLLRAAGGDLAGAAADLEAYLAGGADEGDGEAIAAALAALGRRRA